MCVLIDLALLAIPRTSDDSFAPHYRPLATTPWLPETGLSKEPLVSWLISARPRFTSLRLNFLPNHTEDDSSLVRRIATILTIRNLRLKH
jgi:hypothetical protein